MSFRAYLSVDSDEPIVVFTGQLVKTLIYSLCKELRILHGIRGILSPIHLSPLFKPSKKDFELGDLVTPTYSKEDDTLKLNPIILNGEFIIHVGGDESTIIPIMKGLEKLRTPLSIKFKANIVTFKLEKMEDVTKTIAQKELTGDRVTLYLKGPVKPFNIFAVSRLPKFSISAYEVLMTGYMFYKNAYTITYNEVTEAMKILGLLVETYYSLNTVKPILLHYKGKEPAMIGKITYIIDTRDNKIRTIINQILNISEITGVGESRANGFGTITYSEKK
jgi:hypothetical protein